MFSIFNETKKDIKELKVLNDYVKYVVKELDLAKIDEYIKNHTYEKGILLIRRYYGISARKE